MDRVIESGWEGIDLEGGVKVRNCDVIEVKEDSLGLRVSIWVLNFDERLNGEN